jgi:hypothetical protein
MAAGSSGPYCLHCFAPLVRGKSLCGACGFVSTVSQRRRYWNLHPTLMRAQTTIQVASAIGLLVPAAFIRGLGLATAFLWVAAHYTASTLTARVPYFRARWFWTIAFILAALVLAVGTSSVRPTPVAAGVALVLGLVSRPLGRRFSRWKQRLIMAGAERVSDPGRLLAEYLAEPRDHAFEIQRHYCLRCFATVAADDARCERCGHISRGRDRERYWTMKPGLLLVSRTLQTLTVLVVPAFLISWLCLGGGLRSAGPPEAMAILPAMALAILLSVPAYWTFGHLVRHEPDLDLLSFWVVVALAAALALVRVHLTLAGVFAGAALVVALIGRAARRLKARLIAVGPREDHEVDLGARS